MPHLRRRIVAKLEASGLEHDASHVDESEARARQLIESCVTELVTLAVRPALRRAEQAMVDRADVEREAKRRGYL